MTKSEMIDKLIDDDLNDWNSKTDQQTYLYKLLENGFKGYLHHSEDELLAELKSRELIQGNIVEITFEYPDVHLIHLKDGRIIGINSEYVCLYKDFDEFYDCGTHDIPTINLNQGE